MLRSGLIPLTLLLLMSCSTQTVTVVRTEVATPPPSTLRHIYLPEYTGSRNKDLLQYIEVQCKAVERQCNADKDAIREWGERMKAEVGGKGDGD